MDVRPGAPYDDRLLDAAVLVLDRDGYHGATFAAVATCAELEPAQVEVAFGDIGRMFLATVDRFLVGQIHKYDDTIEADDWDEAALAYGRKVAQARLEPSVASWDRVLIEFWVVASRDPNMSGEVKRRNTANLDRVGAILAAFVGRYDRVPVIVPREFARGIFAIGRGMGLERTMDADWDPDEVAQMVAAYLHGMTRSA